MGHRRDLTRTASTTAAAVALLVCATLAGGCGDDGGAGTGTRAATTATAPGTGAVVRVPADQPTIQRAVDVARPGELVLIAPGVYHEAVVVPARRRAIVIRGESRDGVVLDGRDRLGNGITVNADGVAVENLTVRRYLVNGVLWSPPAPGSTGAEESATAGSYDADAVTSGQLQGWRGSYLTVADNGLYGVYAFGAEHGRFDHVYASGHPDSGVYVGRCDPCHALVRDSVAERNHVGYEATNASGDVLVTRNRWSGNRVGVQLNSLRKEAAFPQHDSALVDNVVAGNQARDAPRGSQGFGAGIVVNGGVRNVVRANRVRGHVGVGVIVLDSDDATAAGNVVRGNRLRGNRLDLALAAGDGRSHGNCFAANRGDGGAPPSSVPNGLERATAGACGRSVALSPAALALPAAPPQVDYRTVPLPAAQPQMPDARTAPPEPAIGRPELALR
jgi:hypothetical protein